MKKNARTEKIFLMGIDGMDPDTTRRLVDEGKMPNVKALIDRGAWRKPAYVGRRTNDYSSNVGNISNRLQP